MSDFNEAVVLIAKCGERHKTYGSGLGLYIVKTILEQHNIIYSLKNTDRGVLFSIRF